MLVPNYVYAKPYYTELYPPGAQPRPLLLVPPRRYTYWAPTIRGGAGEGTTATAPYHSIWIMDKLPATHKAVARWARGVSVPDAVAMSKVRFMREEPMVVVVGADQ